MSSTASQWLISELRRVREREGLTQEAFASRIHFSSQHVSNVEGGRRPVTSDYLAPVDRAFNTDLLGFYREFVRDEIAPVWLLPWLAYEDRAVSLRFYHPSCVPGLVQTEAYARMVLATCSYGHEERERQVRTRLDRQALLDRDPPVRVSVILDEIVIRRGDPAVMREQLERLVELASRPSVTIRIIPTDAPPHMGWFGPMILAELEDDGSVGFLDNPAGGTVATDPARLRVMAEVWESVSSAALPAGQSVELIKEVGKTWT